ncbi:MAG: SulP family inorganic anion transporter [Thermodesulfobacteriota bacterium]
MMAGLLVFAVSIPASVAYALLAGLQPIHGFYSSLLSMGIYALFGTSRHMIPDSEATMAIMVTSSLALFAAQGDPARYLALAMMQAIMAGAILLIAGVFRVGFISDFIPKSVVIGFLNGMALIILVAQLGKITGVQLTENEFFPRLWEFYTRIQMTHYLTLYIGLSCLLGLFLFRIFPKIPGALVVAVLATVAVFWWNLGERGIELVGLLPMGLPRPAIPNVGFYELLDLLPFSAAIALVSYVDTITTGRAFAIKGGNQIDPDQEMVALGLCNLGAGLCQGFAIGCSQSRTVVNIMYGGRTQLAGLFACGFVALFLLYSAEILKDMPVVALTAIIFMAAIRLFNIKEVLKAWRTRPASAYISVFTTVAVLFTGLMIGILVAVALAIILVLHRLARPHEIITRPATTPGLLIYRFGGPLFFFNATFFANRVQELINSARPQVNFFLINAEAIVDMDVNAVEMLEELHSDLKSRGIILGICGVKGHFRKVLTSTHLTSRTGFNLYPDIATVFKELSKEQPAKDKESAGETPAS